MVLAALSRSKSRRRRPGSPRAQEGEATGVSEARSFEGTVGRKRPRSRLGRQTPANARPNHTHDTSSNRVSSKIRRSVPSVVKTLGSPVKPDGAQTP